jgi:hypothetical protein
MKDPHRPGQIAGALTAAVRDARDLSLSGRAISAHQHLGRYVTEPCHPGDAGLYEAMAWYGFQSGQAGEALVEAETAIRLWREQGSRAGEGRTRAIHAWLCLELGDGTAAEGALEALRLCEECDDPLALS